VSWARAGGDAVVDPEPTAAPARTRIEPLAGFRDARGSLFEPLNERELADQRNVHVVLTEPGCIRGNHYHPHSTEVTAVVGPCLVRLKEAEGLRDVLVPAGETWRLTIPPGVVHAYRNTGPNLMVLISFNTSAHDPANPDTVRETILE
jgi:UDP-2-acetamido-2,6-beta-L-arabino-hexul-4-ose reductase